MMTGARKSGDFPVTGYDDWLEAARRSLKGQDPAALFRRSHDGFDVRPVYSADGASGLAVVPGRSGPWTAMQRVDDPDMSRANAQLHEDLANGATGLTLIGRRSISAHAGGIATGDCDELERLLDGVRLDAIELRLEGGRKLASLLAAFLQRRGLDPARATIRAGLDPLSMLARFGDMGISRQELAARLVDAAQALGQRGFAHGLLAADSRVYHNAGASPAQELACLLAVAVQYLRWLQAGGIEPRKAVGLLDFIVAVDADFFMGLAKLRTMRHLWARLCGAMEVPGVPAFIHAETSWRMMAARDVHVNMLRTTTAVMAAGMGGADSLTVLPFSLPLGLPDAMARRMARNEQIIAMAESHVEHVADPGAGAGLVEDLSSELAARAWRLFQRIEAAGGMAVALRDGLVLREISKVAQKRQRHIAHRREALTGVSEYPDLKEVTVPLLNLPDEEPAAPAAAFRPRAPRGGAAMNSMIDYLAGGGAVRAIAERSAGGRTRCRELPQTRLDDDFERLRRRADALERQTGQKPAVFLALLGPPAGHSARAGWARNLFAAGGMAASGHAGSVDELAAAFARSGARLACLCGPDRLYEASGEAVAEALRKAGARQVWLAGKPGESLKGIGIDRFIHIGVDVVAGLDAALQLAGETTGKESAA
ncbi:MAG TPA: methylmalonyl-CoA mutase [Rhodobacteraceae bacterium]|nr:methylmalonyl-CoA mutase [Paracoccaceae bacterium]